MKTIFSDGTSFREYLSAYIESDPDLQYTISQGWHKFAVQKGSYGGAIKEENYNRLSRYDDHLNQAKRALANIYKDNPNLSEEIRNQIQHCLDQIDNVARDGLQNDNASREINEIVQDFNKWLNSNLVKDSSNLREKLKQRISAFQEQATQTLRINYQATLQEFLSQAQKAERDPTNPEAVHVADRVNFTRDDIDLENIARDSTKIRNDPNIIASAIYGRLSKGVPQNEQRFNTVAVGIHQGTLYVALNHIGVGADKKDTYGIDDAECVEVCQWLTERKLLTGRYKITFLEERTAPTDRTSCRAPHAEMQTMRFWKVAGILQQENPMKQGKPWSIGASKPACLCCSIAMKNSNVAHKTHGKANRRPANWFRFADIKVRPKVIWNVQSAAPRNWTNAVHQ